jgi:aryl-alcohol dehydrogenase-like predicted oxidoreductase
MRQIALGDELSVSAIGLGAMGMSAFYGPSDEQTSVATLRHAVDIGVTFIDTAEAYGPFVNEQLIGRALRARRHEITIATKASAETDDDGTVHGRNGTPAYIRRACERSLRHLDTDIIDLYYLHRADPAVPIEESVGAMAELVHEGKIRHIGLSEVATPTMRRAHAVHPIAAIQSEFSLFAPDILHNGEKATADELGIGFVAFSPLGRGMLTNSLRTLDELASDDARRTLPRFAPDAFAANRALVEHVEAIAHDLGVTVAQVALAWVLAEGVVPIPGSRHPARLDENAAAADIRLEPATHRRLTDAIARADVVGSRDGIDAPQGTDR